jgi:hypothetical protein
MTQASSLPRALRDLYACHRTGLAPIWHPATGLAVDIKVPAGTTLAPARTRCKACRKSLGDLVVLQMYCSYPCAHLPAPGNDVASAPRECKRAARDDEPGEWTFKQKFPTRVAAGRYLRPGSNVYRCGHCFFLHIGNASPPPRTGLPATPTGHGILGDATLAILQVRGQKEDSPAALAAAKRDARAVFEVLLSHGLLPATAIR